MKDQVYRTRLRPLTTVSLGVILAVASISNLWGQVRIDVTNHLIDAGPHGGFMGEGIVAFAAKEGPQGSDLNGDGDVSDGVVHVLDLSTGSILNLGLAVNHYTVSYDIAIRGDLVAIPVLEIAQGGIDLNGDGDGQDRVTSIYRISTGETVSLGLESRRPVLGNEFVAFMVREEMQGQDLNGDADMDDAVPHIFDARTGMTKNLQLSAWGDFISGDGYAAFMVLEEPGRDLNGDGDFDDRVLHVWDASDQSVTNAGVAVQWLDLSGDRVVVPVSEAEQSVDLNDDGDLWDRVPHVYDVQTRSLENIGLAFGSWRVGESLFAFSVLESLETGSLNGDGDLTDWVLHLYDLQSGAIENLALVTDPFPIVADRRALFRVHEGLQGETDLNGDGDTSDWVMHVFDQRSGETVNLGYASGPITTGDESGFAFEVREDLQGEDLNGDGAADDEVLHFWNARSGTVTNLGIEVLGWIQAKGRLAIMRLESANQYEDLNGDHDTLDRVVQVYDGTTLHNLGLQGRGVYFDGETVVFSVVEGSQGAMDLNGDGDILDWVLHTATLTDQDVETLIEDLIDDVRDLIADGEISYGRGRSLIAELQVALWFLGYNGGEPIAAIRIELFIIKVERMIVNDQVDPDLGAELLSRARTILDLLRG